MFDALPSRPQPLDQADGLRRLFAASRVQFVPVLSNPHAAFTGVMLERLTAVFSEFGLRTLLVDAAENAPEPDELAVLDLASCVETLSPEVSYLAARGLPLRYVDAHGSTVEFLQALADAVPRADVILIHAGAADLARMFARRDERPLLLANDHPASVTHAYAGMKLLHSRGGLMVFDLLLAASARSPRIERIAGQIARCADEFFGAVLHGWACIDPASSDGEEPAEDLRGLVHLMLHRPGGDGSAVSFRPSQSPAAEQAWLT